MFLLLYMLGLLCMLVFYFLNFLRVFFSIFFLFVICIILIVWMVLFFVFINLMSCWWRLVRDNVVEFVFIVEIFEEDVLVKGMLVFFLDLELFVIGLWVILEIFINRFNWDFIDFIVNGCFKFFWEVFLVVVMVFEIL